MVERLVKTVSLLEFRQQAQAVLSYVQKGQSVLLTNRGKPVARLEPVRSDSAGQDDPFYSLYRLADVRGESLTNDEIDRAVYGS
jgi:prevent-host-death family protein